MSRSALLPYLDPIGAFTAPVAERMCDLVRTLSLMRSSWSGTETERYDLFVLRASELLDRRVVRDGALQSQFSINFDVQTGMKMTVPQPDEEDLRSFLLSLRPFVSSDEPVFVDVIHNRLWQDIESDRSRSELAAARSYWKQACRDGALALNIDGGSLDSSEIFDCWINGIYFHNDSRKRTRLAGLNPMTLFIARFKFLDHLVVATRHIAYLRAVIMWTRSAGLLHH